MNDTAPLSMSLEYHADIPAAYFDEYVAAMREAGCAVELRPRPVTIYNALEWAIPTAIVIYLARPFLDAVLKRAADDFGDAVYAKLKTAIGGLVAKLFIRTRIPFYRVTAGSEPQLDPNLLSIVAEVASQRRCRFVFRENATEIDYSEQVSKALHVVATLPSQGRQAASYEARPRAVPGSDVLVFDARTREWVPAEAARNDGGGPKEP